LTAHVFHLLDVLKTLVVKIHEHFVGVQVRHFVHAVAANLPAGQFKQVLVAFQCFWRDLFSAQFQPARVEHAHQLRADRDVARRVGVVTLCGEPV